MENKELTGRIIGAAIAVHKTLAPGFLEEIYEVHPQLRHYAHTVECFGREEATRKNSDSNSAIPDFMIS
jgi:hypothetical protein